MKPFELGFNDAHARISGHSGPRLAQGDLADARAYKNLEVLKQFADSNTPDNIGAAAPLTAGEDLTFGIPFVFTIAYSDLKLAIRSPFVLDESASLFPRGAEQREVYRGGRLTVSWRIRVVLFGIPLLDSSRETQVPGEAVLRFQPQKDAAIAGFFLGLMESPPLWWVPRIMITFSSSGPLRFSNVDLMPLRDVQFFGNTVWGNQPEALGDEYVSRDFLTPTFEHVPPKDFNPQGMKGTDAVLDTEKTGGFGFGGADGTANGSAIRRVTLELLDDNDSLLASTSTQGMRLVRNCGAFGGSERTAGAKIRDSSIALDSEDERVLIDWWVDKTATSCACRFRLRYTLEGVLASL